MKNTRQILGLAFMSFALTGMYGCELKPKKATTEPVLAQAFTTASDEKPKTNTVKIALLLDTSNSMDGLINQAKSQLWDIVNKFTYAKCGNEQRPELQIALYQYGNDNNYLIQSIFLFYSNVGFLLIVYRDIGNISKYLRYHFY